MPRQSLVLHEAMWTLSIYRRHCQVSKRGLDEELSQLENDIENELRDLEEFEQEVFFRQVKNHWIETADTLPRLQWYSQLLVVYGYFEKLLNDLCNEQRIARNLNLSLKDLHGQGIERARNYLIKVVGLEKAFSTPEWQSIQLLGVLRNSVAHKDGFVDYEPDSPKSVYSNLSRIAGVELRQEVKEQKDAQIFFNEQLVLETLNLFDTFIQNLAAEIESGQAD